jgi:hypothetical protein
MSQNVFAGLPLLDIQGDFDYKRCSGGPMATRCQLTLSTLIITGGNYLDNTQFGHDSSVFDAIEDAYFVFTWSTYTNTFYNSASDNLDFTPTSTATFTITDGTTDYLTATFDNFLVDDYTFFGNKLTKLNFDLTDENITNVVLDTGTGVDYSDYIAELQQYILEPYNLTWTFTFNPPAGPYGDGTAFTEDASGSFSGKLHAGPVVPEPVSSILFVTGGATLAARRYWKRKKR